MHGKELTGLARVATHMQKRCPNPSSLAYRTLAFPFAWVFAMSDVPREVAAPGGDTGRRVSGQVARKGARIGFLDRGLLTREAGLFRRILTVRGRRAFA